MQTIQIPVTHYSLKELSRFYGVCDKTLVKWLKPYTSEIGEKRGRYFNIRQVQTIIQKLGQPQCNN